MGGITFVLHQEINNIDNEPLEYMVTRSGQKPTLANVKGLAPNRSTQPPTHKPETGIMASGDQTNDPRSQMFGVYAPDADAVRRLIPSVSRLLEWPYCSYLIYLARHVDHEAIAFLDRYARAVHDETGEALAVIVLFDSIEVLGRVRGWEDHDIYGSEPPQVVEDPRIAYGSYPLPPDRVPQRTTGELHRASPRWSLRFADALGLSRSFVPRIVAFDNVSGAESEDCVVLDLSNADQAWETLRDAIASFMTVPASQRFVVAAERLRALTRDLLSAEREFERTAPRWHSPQPFYLMPATPGDLLHVLSQPSHPDRNSVIDLISRRQMTRQQQC